MADAADRLRSLGDELTRPDTLHLDLAGCEDYFRDATEMAATPAAILIAESTEDVRTAVVFCHRHGIPITARGAGTGLSGGCVPTQDSLVVSLERLIEMKIDSVKKTAICGPGVITKDLIDAAAKHGLTYAPDPASYAESTLGGNVAENAGGLRCKRHGVTRDYVLGLEAVTSDGSFLRTGSFSGNRGLSLTELLIGSEGTLAIITRMALRLIDLPGRGITVLVAFSRPEDAAGAVAKIGADGVIPTVLEFLDGDAAACSNAYEPNPGLQDAAAILLFETSDCNPQEQLEAIRAACRSFSSTHFRSEADPAKAEDLWKIRRNLSKAVKEMAPLRVSEDVAVPISRFPDLVAFAAELNRTSPLRINSFGHAGDGNLHVQFLASEDSPQNRRLIDETTELLMRRTIELGGTLTGEHGIGLAKRHFLALEFTPSTLKTMSVVKSIFDPQGRFNPDKLLGSQSRA